MSLFGISPPNPGASVDAPFASLSHIGQRRRRATEHRRSASLLSMKALSTIGIVLVVMLVSMALGSPARAGQIHDAAKAGDVGRVAALLKANPELGDAKDEHGWTPLHWAVRDRHKEVVELLLASNADVNATNNFGSSPLVLAVMGPSKGEVWTEDKKAAEIEMVKLLLAHNADSSSQQEALRWAVSRSSKDIVGLLLASKADVHALDKSGQTALHVAAENGRKDIVELLLANKADINAKDKDGNTPLLAATSFGQHKDVAELLLARGAEVNATNNSGQTSLHQAVSWCEKDLVKLLLSNKADANARDYDGWTALHKAADVAVGNRKDAVEVMELLLASNADVRAKDKRGLTPLHWAAGNSLDVTELLLTNKAQINAKDNHGWTPLNEAEYYSRHDVAKLLRQHGGRDFVGEIGDAARRGSPKKVKALLKDDPDLVFSTDKYGATPLHCAASKDVAELLLTSKAAVNAKNYDGVTPLHMAVSKGNKEVAELLRQHGGKE
jgi:ankyrin repeat protein